MTKLLSTTLLFEHPHNPMFSLFLKIKIMRFLPNSIMLIFCCCSLGKRYLFQVPNYYKYNQQVLTSNKQTTRYFFSKMDLVQEQCCSLLFLNLGCVVSMQTMHKTREEKRDMFIYREKGKFRGAVVNRVHWRKLEFEVQ